MYKCYSQMEYNCLILFFLFFHGQNVVKLSHLSLFILVYIYIYIYEIFQCLLMSQVKQANRIARLPNQEQSGGINMLIYFEEQAYN